jgi:hypothetical protein
LDFYGPEAFGTKEGRFFDINSWPPDGPEWVICHKDAFDDASPPGRVFVDDLGNHYQLMKTFPTAPLSGLHWYIYHNQLYESRR